MRIYFAHPYATIGTEDEARIIAELKKRGEEIHNPFEDDKNKEWMKRFRTGEFSIKDAIRLVEFDLFTIDMSDAVLVWLPIGVYTCGTFCELVYAHYSGIPTTVIHSLRGEFLEFNLYETRRADPWIWYHASELYLTIEDWIKGTKWTDKRIYREIHESKDYQ